jgi:hypothetical protein
MPGRWIHGKAVEIVVDPYNRLEQYESDVEAAEKAVEERDLLLQDLDYAIRQVEPRGWQVRYGDVAEGQRLVRNFLIWERMWDWIRKQHRRKKETGVWERG